MIKYIENIYEKDNSKRIKIIDDHLEKTAELSEDLTEAIDNIKAKPGNIYLLVNALSAGEFYGPNKNLDYFPENILKEYHKTFEALGHVFKHHRNKIQNGDRVYGKVTYSHYNKKMHRVELIVEVSEKAAPDIVDRINSGDLVATSMGCKVPFDICSKCGNRATKKSEYCSCIREARLGNKIDRNGLSIHLINTRPKFFDLSFVTIPAEPTSGVMKKVASTEEPVVLSVERAEVMLKESGLKEADITKRINVNIKANEDIKNLIPKSQEDLPFEVIENLSKVGNLNSILSSFVKFRMMPSRRDFQRIVLTCGNETELAKKLDTQNKIFPYIKIEDKQIFHELSSVHPNRSRRELENIVESFLVPNSLTKPLVIVRIISKVASGELNNTKYKEEMELSKLSHLYESFRHLFNLDSIKTASFNSLSASNKIKLAGFNETDFWSNPVKVSQDFFIDAPESYNREPRESVGLNKIAESTELHWVLETSTNNQNILSKYWDGDSIFRNNLYKQAISI